MEALSFCIWQNWGETMVVNRLINRFHRFISRVNNKIRHKPLFTSISTKVFLNTFISVLIGMTAIAMLAYSTIYVLIKDNQEASLQASVVQVEDYLKWYMLNIQSQLLYFSNPDIYELLNDENYALLMNSFLSLNSNEINAAYVIEGGEIQHIAPQLYRHYLSRDLVQEVARQTEQWGFWWSDPFDSGFGRAVTVAKSFSPDDNRNRKITVVLELNVDSFAHLGVSGQSKEQNIYIFSRSGKFVASNVPIDNYDQKLQRDQMIHVLGEAMAETGNDFNTVTTAEGSYRILKSDNNRWDWIVFAVINEANAYPLLSLLQKQFLLLLVTWVSLSAFISYRLALYIKKPIKSIIRQMNASSLGRFDARIDLKRNDEFSIISTHFNKMMVNIKGLFDDLRQAEERKRVQEIKVLQSQIQPHFLYNTLNAFYWLSETDRAKEIGPLIKALMGLLKYSIDKVGDLVPLEQEAEQLQNYADLMKLRYGDVFELDIVIPDELLRRVSIPKLTLITLVENSIFYGLNSSEQSNHIIVTAEINAQRQVIVEVSDSGPGMRQEDIRRLFEKHEDNRNFKGLNNLGLRNIQERIQLYYGPAYGLKIENDPGEGLLVRIKLPCVE